MIAERLNANAKVNVYKKQILCIRHSVTIYTSCDYFHITCQILFSI